MEFEMLASGYGLLEAPRVDDLGRLYFTDIPNGGVYRRNPGGNVETLIPKRKGGRSVPKLAIAGSAGLPWRKTEEGHWEATIPGATPLTLTFNQGEKTR